MQKGDRKKEVAYLNLLLLIQPDFIFNNYSDNRIDFDGLQEKNVMQVTII